MSLRPAVFFDRDGVINVSPGAGYVRSVAEFFLNPGITEVLAWCKTHGYYTVLVTSQQGVGKGLMSQEDLDAIHGHLQKVLGEKHAAFDTIQVCPHLAGTCACRKPSPQMIFAATIALPMDLTASALVGDHDRDIQMARNAGIGYAIRLATDNEICEQGDVLVYSIPEVLESLKEWHCSKNQPHF